MINTTSTSFHLFMKVSAASAGTSGISGSSSAIFECVISPLSILIRIKSSVSFKTKVNKMTVNIPILWKHLLLYIVHIYFFIIVLRQRIISARWQTRKWLIFSPPNQKIIWITTQLLSRKINSFKWIDINLHTQTSGNLIFSSYSTKLILNL